MINKKSKQKW